jgi:Tol biopolymer transport system component
MTVLQFRAVLGVGVAVSALSVTFTGAGPASAVPPPTILVSANPAGAAGNDASVAPAISADGDRIAFQSLADDLTGAADANGFFDVFVRDVGEATTERVSVDRFGQDADAGSFGPSISANGRFVAFQSDASDLVAGDDNGVNDVFVRDLRTDRTERIGAGISAGDPTRRVAGASISGDGRLVAFQVSVGSPVSFTEVYVRDRVADRTIKVSVSRTGGRADGSSVLPRISRNGRYVAFISAASNLVAGDTNGFGDVFRRDLAAHRTALVSVDRFGGPADEEPLGGAPAISGDGRYVVFHDQASDLVANDTNGEPDVFRRDMERRRTVRVSVTSDEEQVSGFGSFHTVVMGINDGGRYVTFSSDFSGLTGNDTNGQPDAFLRDVGAGTTTLVSVGLDGQSPDGFSTQPSINGNGCWVAFTSTANGITPDDTNDFIDDVFRRAVRAC